jgi:hypothetical protein
MAKFSAVVCVGSTEWAKMGKESICSITSVLEPMTTDVSGSVISAT